MGKALIITEKPSVAQEFARILGSFRRNQGFLENDSYVITWCVGHLVEMVYPEEYDEKYKKWKLEDLPFLPREYKYNVIPSVSRQYDVVHGMLYREDIDTVYWAGDAGKEGQTIEENIRNFGGVKAGMKELRVWIDSQTEEEIRRGLKEAKPMSEYANLGRSGIMRTIEDYAMGINFSRAMSVKYGNLLNDAAGTKSYTAIAVGRVMTCVLGMVVIREREIRDFEETPFYRINGFFSPAGKEAAEKETAITAEWKAVEGSRYFASPLLYRENGFQKKEDAERFLEMLREKPASVLELERGTVKKKAPLLFNLAELQAECAKRFKISPDETLQAAQNLYEKKLTTYPRTDARVLSTAVAKEIGKNIGGLKHYGDMGVYAEKILGEGLHRGIVKSAYTDDSKITDHYAIVPTGQLSELRSVSGLEKQIFDLIVRRFLSVFFPPAVYETVKLTLEVDGERFFAGARSLKTPGFLEIAGKIQDEKEDDEKNENLVKAAGSLKKGDILENSGYEIREGKTSPPKRYTSGSMVLAMENAGQLIEDEELRAQIKGSGIGTSATRAEIIGKLVRIGYLNLNRKTQVLMPEALGEMVFEVVSLTVPELLNPRMTASWEKGLDGITRGTVDMEEYRAKLEAFIRKETLSMVERDLKDQLLERIRPLTGGGARGIAARRNLEVSCPVCGGPMQTTPFGYGCGNYRNGEGCRFSIGAIAGRNLSEEEVKALLTEGRTGTLRNFKSKKGKRFDACLVLDRQEDGQVSVRFDFEQVEDRKLEDVVCPDCGGPILKTAFGYACGNRSREGREGSGSCSFSIGKIAEKELSEAQVKELLQTGRTGTIRGFRSRKGKRFDACLVLEKEEGKPASVRFDFENVEAKRVKGVKCPLCGGEITVTPFGYACVNHRQEDPESCGFFIGSVAGVKLKEAAVKELLTEGKTGVLQGFIAKTGLMFDAALKLTEEGRVAFDFPQKEEPEKTALTCPKCGKTLFRSKWQLVCECGFKLFHTVAGVPLSDEALSELFTAGRTREKITGFTSKAGKLFDAFLKLEEGQIRFDFETENGEVKKDGRTENKESV